MAVNPASKRKSKTLSEYSIIKVNCQSGWRRHVDWLVQPPSYIWTYYGKFVLVRGLDSVIGDSETFLRHE